MDGLGYSLSKKGENYFLECNYCGYHFQMSFDSQNVSSEDYEFIICDDDTGETSGTETRQRDIIGISDTEVTNLIYAYMQSNILNSQDYVDWCVQDILGEDVSFVQEHEVTDADSSPCGTQWDYEGTVFVYSDNDCFIKRAVNWVVSTLSLQQFMQLASYTLQNCSETYDTEEYESLLYADEPNLRSLAEKHIEIFGADCGLYQKIKTAPDGKILLKRE